ncbi:hypothetical protein LSCM1_05532 [Leishmania martiniquensis]|uniref:Uncharacterized protein n=1 Tax=Leishmania martiniquensis TaxID=1580590 RepID=A0A836GWN7_9TRYP|nr:hypothetical protein LSCM1_05532 [Leishmania martiniquensis]
MDTRETQLFTLEKQRRPSPRAASTENGSSSVTYPSGQESGTTPATGSSGSGAAAAGHGACRPASERVTVATATAASPRTPPPRGSGSVRHLAREGGTVGPFWDVTAFASPASTFASTTEYGRAMADLLDSVASASSTSASRTPPPSSSSLPGGKAARPSSRQRHLDQPPPPQRWPSSAEVTAPLACFGDVEGRADGSPEWGRRTPTQQKQQGQQQCHRSAPPHDPLPASRMAQQERVTTLAEVAATYTSTISVDDETSSHLSTTPLAETRARRGSDWASPSEVLQLRALFQNMVSRYTKDVQALTSELAKAQEERAAYARERKKVRELQQACEDGVAACARAKEWEAQWVEERALLRVQMERVMVENQQLQLHMLAKQKSHIHRAPLRGGATGRRERVQAAVQAVASATTAMSSASPSPCASWPPLPLPTTVTPTTMRGYSASPQSLDSLGARGFHASLPSAARAAATGMEQTDVTLPYTFLSSTSSLPEVLQYSAPQRGGGGAAALSPPPISSSTSRQIARAGSTSPTSAGGAAGTQQSHSMPPQRSYPSASGDAESAGKQYGDCGHASTRPLQQRGGPQRYPRSGANHNEEPHNSSIMTPSLSTSDAATSSSVGAAAAAACATSGSEDDQGGAEQSVRPPHQQWMRPDGREGGVCDATREGELNPSYALGVAELSCTSGGSSSPSPAANIHTMLPGGDLVQVPEQGAGDHSGGGGCHLLEQVGGETVGEGVAAASAPSSSPAATAASGLPTTVTASAATATTPSLGSSATMTAASSWSLQYLYQLPRTPAEALQEELRLLKEVRRLDEENQVLHARLDYLQALKEIDTNRCEQQRLRIAQAHDQSRHSAMQWELSSRQLESQVRQSEAKCVELQEALRDVLQMAKKQQELSQARLVELEMSCRARLDATRDEAMAKVGALRNSLREMAASLATMSASPLPPTVAQEVAQLREERGQHQCTIERLQSELHTLRAAHETLQVDYSALQADAQMRRARLEGDLASSRELLATAQRDQECAKSRIEELEEEVERLRAAVTASEGCMHAMEERLRLATDELTVQQERLDEASVWQARALGAEEELGTQRAYYEEEIDVYKTAGCALQDRHHAEVEGLVRRYERLQVRYEAAKVRLAAAVSRFGAAAVLAAAGGNIKTRRSQRKKADSDVPANSPGDLIDTVGPSPLPATIQAGASPSHVAAAAYDTLQALRASGQVTEKLMRSLNRSTSPP